jgi:hypothetical protein
MINQELTRCCSSPLEVSRRRWNHLEESRDLNLPPLHFDYKSYSEWKAKLECEIRHSEIHWTSALANFPITGRVFMRCGRRSQLTHLLLLPSKRLPLAYRTRAIASPSPCYCRACELYLYPALGLGIDRAAILSPTGTIYNERRILASKAAVRIGFGHYLCIYRWKSPESDGCAKSSIMACPHQWTLAATPHLTLRMSNRAS